MGKAEKLYTQEQVDEIIDNEHQGQWHRERWHERQAEAIARRIAVALIPLILRRGPESDR